MGSPTWRKSSFSDNGECVELAGVGAAVAVRDSKLGDGSPVLELSHDQLRELLGGIKTGRLDDLQ